MQYKASDFWDQDCERSMRWNDPTLQISWPLKRAGVQEPLLAAKDGEAPFLADFEAAAELF